MDLMETVWGRVSDGAPYPGQGQALVEVQGEQRDEMVEVGEGHNSDVEEGAIEPATVNQAGGSETQPTGSTYQVFTTCYICDFFTPYPIYVSIHHLLKNAFLSGDRGLGQR